LPLQPKRPSNLSLALRDLTSGIGSVNIWPMLGWLEIKQRYRRSVLGPFWLTLSSAVMVGAMGPLYGRLFNLPLANYLPFLAISLILWTMINGLVTECCQVFIAAEGFIKQIKLPYTVHVMRVIWRNAIIFAHNVVVVLVVLLIFPPGWSWHLALFPLAVVLLAINAIWLGLLLGLLCARFRDIPPIVSSLLQVAFFLTPVLWRPEMLGRHRWALDWNPLYYFLEIVRSPLLGQSFSPKLWVGVVIITVVGYAVTMALFSRFRARIPYWV
jgi:homopolymeric O-antigen transport system permease protein